MWISFLMRKLTNTYKDFINIEDFIMWIHNGTIRENFINIDRHLRQMGNDQRLPLLTTIINHH